MATDRDHQPGNPWADQYPNPFERARGKTEIEKVRETLRRATPPAPRTFGDMPVAERAHAEAS